jgi:hypothetical protein
MNRLSKSIWTGRYGVIGFDQNGAAVIGKKVLTPADQAEQAAERFRDRMMETLRTVREETMTSSASADR